MHIESEIFEEPVAIKMALKLKSKSLEILIICGTRWRACNHDAETTPLQCFMSSWYGWNQIVDKEDTLIFAPVQRDLMFIGSGIWGSGLALGEEESFIGVIPRQR